MRLITAEEVIAMKPCLEYTEEIIRANHGPDGITARQIAELDMPILHRVWVLRRLVPHDVRHDCISRNACGPSGYMFTGEAAALVDYLEQHDETEAKK